VHGFTDQPDDVEVMQHMPDAILQLSAERRPHRRGRMTFVSAAADDHTIRRTSVAVSRNCDAA
jgi:hypothetical protein